MMGIQQISQELGIGVDSLRIWERRYGFPTPQRDRRGHRSYPHEQVEELRLVKKLRDMGQRPGTIFSLTPNQRRGLLEKLVAEQTPGSSNLRYLATEMPMVEIAPALRQVFETSGLYDFILESAVPLLKILGLGWADGSINIAREHVISDLLEDLISREMASQQPASGPRILFLTLSGERHRLGLLLAAALFQQQGCEPVLIQEDLPLREVSPLADELKVAAVALSFSSHFQSTQAKKSLVSLRKILDPRIGLIAGGGGIENCPYLAGISLCCDLGQITLLWKKEFVAQG